MDDSFHHGLVLFASNPPGGGSDPRGANRGRQNAMCQGRVAHRMVMNCSFPETQFIAVTAYQNEEVSVSA